MSRKHRTIANVKDYGADPTTALSRALASGRETVYLPGGIWPYSGAVIVPDGVSLRGDGIYHQGVPGGGGGTWLKATGGLRWGSHSNISYMLAGANTSVYCYFRPLPRKLSGVVTETDRYGSHDCRFEAVRFKGGCDDGRPLLNVEVNWSPRWDSTLKTYDMYDTVWNDCEFERPQSSNAVNGIRYGEVIKVWTDLRAGGSQVHDLQWNRCHLGVKNGYRAGVDSYGVGRTVIFQGSPDSGGTGPSLVGGSEVTSSIWNEAFDWRLADHNFRNISFTDCLMEYSSWYPLNPCDYSRPYSTWQSCREAHDAGKTYPGGAREPWGNPPGANWTLIPDSVWGVNYCSLVRCYLKGSYPKLDQNATWEIGRNVSVVDSFIAAGQFGTYAGHYGNVKSGSFSNATRPQTALFPADWSGARTDYTPSPFDP